MLLHSYALLTIQNRYARLDHLIVTKIIELEFIDEKNIVFIIRGRSYLFVQSIQKNICITYQNIWENDSNQCSYFFYTHKYC